MSDVIDNRVVKMEFNNENFEKGVGHTLASLDKLSEGLRRINGAKQFQDITAAANGVDLSRIAAGIDALTQKFSVLGIAGMTVVNKLTSGLMGLVHKGLSQAISGGMSRALNLEQASFMLKNTFKDAEDTEAEVEKVMNAVNDSVTGTRYGLDQAAKAAAQLTASGVEVGNGMEEALAGIAGLATIANTDYDSISHIFTAVAGQGKLMTIQMRQLELRGVNVAAEMAKVWPQIHNGATKTEEEIRDMVSKGKIDFNEFSQAMNLAFGDSSKKANETFTGALANMKAAISRIGALFAVPYIENMRKIFVSMIGVFNALKKSIEPVAEGFSNIFGAATDKFVAFVDSFLSLGGEDASIIDKIMRFIYGLSDSQNILDTLSGFGAIINILKTGLSALLNILSPLAPMGKGLLSLVLSITGAIGRFLVRLDDTIQQNRLFQNIAFVLVKALNALKDTAIKVFDALRKPFDMFSRNHNGFNISDGLELDLEKLSSVRDKISKVLGTIASAVKRAFGAIAEVFKGGDLKPLLQLIEGGLLLTIGLSINQFVHTLTSGATSVNSVLESIKGVANIKDNIIGVLDAVKGRLTAWEDDINQNSLLKIAAAIAILAAALVVIASIDSEKLATSLGAVGALMFTMLKGVTSLSAMLEGKGLRHAGSLIAVAISMELIAGGILILAGAMKVLATIDVAGLAKGLGSIYLLLRMFGSTADLLSTEGKNMIRNAVGFVIFGAAIRVLAESVKVFGEMDLNELGKGLLAVIALIGAISLITNKFSPNMGVLDGVGILLMAFAIEKLSQTVEVFSKMNKKELIKGVGAVGVLLGELAAFSNIMGRSKHVLTSAISIYILAQSLQPLISAMAIIGHMNMNQIGKGLLGLAGGLAVMVASLKVLKSGLRAAISLKIVSDAVASFVSSMQRAGIMSASTIEKGLIAIAGGLAAMVIAMKLSEHAVMGALSMVIMAHALAILTPVLLALGDMSMKEIGKALLTVAGALLVMAGASVLLLPAVPAMMAFSVAVALLGAGLLAAGAGILAFTTAIALLSELTGAGIESAKVAILSFAEIFPELFEQVALGIVSMVGTLTEHIPEIVEMGMQLLLALLQGISDNIEQITTLVGEIISKFLESLANSVGQIIDSAFTLVVSVLNGIADAIYSNSGEIVGAIDRIIGSILYFALEALKTGLDHLDPTGWLSGKISEWQDGISKEFNLDKAAKDGEEVAEATTNAYSYTMQNAGLDQDVDYALGEAESAVDNHKEPLKSKVEEVVSGAAEAAEDGAQGFESAGENAISGFIGGMETYREAAKSKAESIIADVVAVANEKLKINSPSKVFISIGSSVGEGFVMGIDRMASAVSHSSENMAEGAISFASSLTRRLASSMESSDFQPTIRPVLDLTNVEEGAQGVSSMFSGMTLGTSMDYAGTINAQLQDNQNGSYMIQSMMDQMLYKMNDLTKAMETRQLDSEMVYDAVRMGASNAKFKIQLNNRELTRGLKDLGVAMR